MGLVGVKDGWSLVVDEGLVVSEREEVVVDRGRRYGLRREGVMGRG